VMERKEVEWEMGKWEMKTRRRRGQEDKKLGGRRME
jgi:hypothetical protein